MGRFTAIAGAVALFVGVLGVATEAPAVSELMITGYMDGAMTGGSPKVVEVFARGDIGDLSRYQIGRSSGGTPIFASPAPSPLPAIALSAGDFYYFVGNAFDDQTDRFDLVFPSLTTQRALHFGVNSNGDDTTGLL